MLTLANGGEPWPCYNYPMSFSPSFEETVMPVRERSVGWRWLLLSGLLVLAGAQASAQESPSEARMRKDMFYLAGKECEGRDTGSPGIEKAAEHIANEFKKAGLKP